MYSLGMTGIVNVTGTANSAISLTGTGNGYQGMNLTPSTTFNVAGPGSLTVSIPLANPDASLGGTAAAMTKTGSGLMTLSGANTYSGTTTVSRHSGPHRERRLGRHAAELRHRRQHGGWISALTTCWDTTTTTRSPSTAWS